MINILKAVATLAAWIAGGFVLRRYEFFIAFFDIDNIVGMIPVTLVAVAAGSLTALLWMRHTRQFAPVSAAFALFVVNVCTFVSHGSTGQLEDKYSYNRRAGNGA